MRFEKTLNWITETLETTAYHQLFKDAIQGDWRLSDWDRLYHASHSIKAPVTLSRMHAALTEVLINFGQETLEIDHLTEALMRIKNHIQGHAPYSC